MVQARDGRQTGPSTLMSPNLPNLSSAAAAPRRQKIEPERQNHQSWRTGSELQASRDRYAQLFERVPVGCLVLDPEARIRESNLRAAALLGQEPARLRGRPLAALLAADEGPRLAAHLQRARAGLHGASAEMALVGGARVCLESTPLDGAWDQGCLMSVLRKTNGQQVLFEALEAQVAARTRELTATCARLELAEELAELGRWEWWPGGNRIAWSAQVHRIFGISPEAFAGTPEAMLSRVHPDDRERVEAAARTAVRRGQALDIEYRIQHPRKGVRYLHSRGRPLFDHHDRVVALHGAVQDVTMHKRAERRLATLSEENRRLARRCMRIQEEERRALARELHDELGQYLTAIGLEASALRHRLHDPVASTALEEIGAIAQRALYQARRIGRRLHPPALAELGLRAAIGELVDEWRHHLGEVRLETFIGEDLEGLGPLAKLALYRVVQEGLTNVARHARAQRVWLCLERRGSRVLLRLRDDGQVDGSPRGEGLGLVGLRERIEGLGGRLRAGPLGTGGFLLIARLPVTGPPS